MQIGQLIDFRKGVCEIVYFSTEETILRRRSDDRLFLWSKRALFKWGEDKKERDEKARKEAEKKANKERSNHVN